MDYDHLKLDVYREKATIKNVDGRRTINGARDTFSKFTNISKEFVFIDNRASATPQTEVGIYPLKGRGDYRTIFSALHCCWAQKCLTQDQILEFYKQLHVWMQGDRHALFLVNIKENKPFSEDHPEENLVVVHIISSGYPQEEIFWTPLNSFDIIEGSNYNGQPQPYLVVPELP
jgi:hypothetical protein